MSDSSIEYSDGGSISRNSVKKLAILTIIEDGCPCVTKIFGVGIGTLKSSIDCIVEF